MQTLLKFTKMFWEGMNIKIELNTQISSLDELRPDILGPYTAVYLGNPYCPKYENNLLENFRELKQAVELAHGMGKKAYVSTYAAPGTDDLAHVLKLIEAAVDAGADALEAHNLGVVWTIARHFPGTVIHSGGLANVYTNCGADHLAGMGVKRITPHYELSLDEIKYIKDTTGVDVEVLLHGKMPLGITRDCFLLTIPEALPCPEACKEAHWLRNKDWVLKSAGTIMLSGKDVCMMEHLRFLLGAGFRVFRIESAFESPEYRKKIGSIYAGVLESYLDGNIAADVLADLAVLSENGFCNGYYFGRSGREYVGLEGSEG